MIEQTKVEKGQVWPFDDPNGWDRDVVRLLALVQKYPHMWLFCSRAKYLELRIDTRDCGFNLYDRDHKPLSPDEITAAIAQLQKQFNDDGSMPSMEYRSGQRQEEPLLDEMQRMRAALTAMAEDDSIPAYIRTLARSSLSPVERSGD